MRSQIIIDFSSKDNGNLPSRNRQPDFSCCPMSWPCAVCTFVNLLSSPVCAVCGVGSPPLAAEEVEEPLYHEVETESDVDVEEVAQAVSRTALRAPQVQDAPFEIADLVSWLTDDDMRSGVVEEVIYPTLSEVEKEAVFVCPQDIFWNNESLIGRDGSLIHGSGQWDSKPLQRPSLVSTQSIYLPCVRQKTKRNARREKVRKNKHHKKKNKIVKPCSSG